MLKVLIVGPDSLSGELSPTVLGRPDIDRVNVTPAAEVLEVAERVKPHMVVVDLAPPEACALARQLRENEGTRPTAIVALSRTPRPDAEIQLRDAGVNVVIPVPIDPLLWDRRLEELLSVPARRGHRIPVRLRNWSRFVSDADEDEGAVVNIGARGVLLEEAAGAHVVAAEGAEGRLRSTTQLLRPNTRARSRGRGSKALRSLRVLKGTRRRWSRAVGIPRSGLVGPWR